MFIHLNYAFAKSMDLGSDAERGYLGAGQLFSALINSWNVRGNRGPSDFDVRHVITGNFVVALPFWTRRGVRFRRQPRAGHADRRLDALRPRALDQWAAVQHYRRLGWGTNWASQSYNVLTGPVATGGHNSNAGNPNVFKNQTRLSLNTRAPYPGEAGQRNFFAAMGYFSIDAGLSKVFRITERQNLKFAFESFNVTNSLRFDPNSISNNLLGVPRVLGTTALC